MTTIQILERAIQGDIYECAAQPNQKLNISLTEKYKNALHITSRNDNSPGAQ
jgi:hypothetical protein